MRQHHVILLLLFAALICMDVVERSIFTYPIDDQATVNTLGGFYFAQMFFLALWGASGSLRSPWRLLLALLAVFFSSLSLFSFIVPNLVDIVPTVIIFVACTMVFVFCFKIINISSHSIANVNLPTTPQLTDDYGARQFSLKTMLEWMTAIAVFLGIIKMAFQWLGVNVVVFGSPSRFIFLMGVLIVFSLGMTLVLLSYWRLKIKGILFALILIFSIVPAFFEGRGSMFWEWIQIVLSFMGAFSLFLAIYRIAGYRLVRVQRSEQSNV